MGLLAQHVNAQFTRGNSMVLQGFEKVAADFARLSDHQRAVHGQQLDLHAALQVFVE